MFLNIRKISILIGKALPLISNECYSLFNDVSKANNMHIHRLHGKEEILKQIFTEYQFNDNAINNFLEGAEIYQLEVPFENGAARVVFEWLGYLGTCFAFEYLDEAAYNRSFENAYRPNENK